MKVKASSNFWRVPSHTNLHLRRSTSGRKCAASSLRTLEFRPSRCDHEVVRLGEIRGAVDLGLKAQVHAEGARPLLQQQKQLPAPDAAEAVPGRDDALAAVVDGDVVPIGEVVADRRRADRVIGGEIGERLVGQHHAPAEGVVRPVALVNGDVVRGVAQLHADREIKASRPAAEARDLHSLPSLLSAPETMIEGSPTSFKLECLSLKLFPGMAQAPRCRRPAAADSTSNRRFATLVHRGRGAARNH